MPTPVKAIIRHDNSMPEMDKRKRALAKAGCVIASKPPYGYDFIEIKIPTGIGRKLVVNEEQASIIRRIYNLYIEDKSIGEIKEILNEMLIASPAGASWSEQAIYRLLFDSETRLKLQGCVVYTPCKSKPESKIITPDAHEAILSRAIIDKVDTMRTSPNHGRGGTARSGRSA